MIHSKLKEPTFKPPFHMTQLTLASLKSAAQFESLLFEDAYLVILEIIHGTSLVLVLTYYYIFQCIV